MSGNPFDYVKDIQYGKKDIIRNSESPEKSEKMYSAFMVNKALSFYPDSILYSNEMNRHPGLDGIMQFDYLLNSVRSMKRKHSWIKKQDEDVDVEMIAGYLNVSVKKAREALRVLTQDQLNQIRQKTMKGGT